MHNMGVTQKWTSRDKGIPLVGLALTIIGRASLAQLFKIKLD